MLFGAAFAEIASRSVSRVYRLLSDLYLDKHVFGPSRHLALDRGREVTGILSSHAVLLSHPVETAMVIGAAAH